MMFALGLILGLFIGGTIGAVTIAFFVGAAQDEFRAWLGRQKH
jgi:hypothetical protein